MRYVILSVLLAIGAFWLGSYAFEHSVEVFIQWEKWGSVTLTSTSVIIIILLSLLTIYLLITILRFLFGLRKRINHYKHQKLSIQANQELTKGLVHFTEGHWQQAEKVLTNNVNHSDTPLLNYLAAARAAHMQNAYEQRDIYLKKASEEGDDAQTAVSVSQAEMQFTSGQLEQARATLIHLLEVSPKHPYAIKLLAKIYYEQEDWSNLLSLLPVLDKASLIKEQDSKKYEITALAGIFMTLAHKNERQKIQLLWKKLPTDIQQRPEIFLLYCQALSDAGDNKTSDKQLIGYLSKNWNEKIIKRYGLIEHENLGVAIKRAEKWLEGHETSPNLLLALARLNKKYHLWGKSKAYYNSSLNFSPNAAVYLELAELLEELGEGENAQTCYKFGLKYAINKKGEILNLKSSRASDSSLAVAPSINEENFLD